MRRPSQNAPIWIEQSPVAESSRGKTPDEIVRAAYRKFGRGKHIEQAVRLGFADKSVRKSNATEGTKP